MAASVIFPRLMRCRSEVLISTARQQFLLAMLITLTAASGAIQRLCRACTRIPINAKLLLLVRVSHPKVKLIMDEPSNSVFRLIIDNHISHCQRHRTSSVRGSAQG
jgi:hypothetical protein